MHRILIIAVAVSALAGCGGSKPVDCSRATSDASARYGNSYDWHCQVQSYRDRLVVVRSEPNGYYWAQYYVSPDGAPRLELSSPPPVQ